MKSGKPNLEDLLRHFIATLVYRLEKAIRDAPPAYPGLGIGNGVRTPVEILSHINFVLTCAHSVFHHNDRLEESEAGTWEEEIDRFHQIVDKLDKAVSAGLPDRDRIAEKLLQGPLSDAMTTLRELSTMLPEVLIRHRSADLHGIDGDDRLC